MGRRSGLASVVAAIAAVGLLPAAASAAGTRTYIVQLKAAPLASYTGGKRGLSATSPKVTGRRKLDTTTSAAKTYTSYLAGRERAALAHAPGSATVDYSYRVAFAGFAAQMTQAQAAAVRQAPEVARVWRDARLKTQAVN